MKKVAVIMGSDSDLPVIQKATDMLRNLEIPFEVHVYSAHRTPEQAKDLYKSNGYSILAYTDHDAFIPHHDLTDKDFLALAGFEAEFFIKRGDPTKKTCHICFIVLP